MEWAIAGLGVAAIVILLAWRVDSQNAARLLAQREKTILELCRLVGIMTLAGAQTDRHQFVGMQQLVKMQAVSPGETVAPEPSPAGPPPEPEGLVLRSSYSL